MASSVTIDALRPGDEAHWRVLWDGNNNNLCPAAVTNETWQRLLNPVFPVHGLVARQGEALAGFVHFVLHPVTGHIQPACYMQDLYVDPAFRQRGIGRMLVEHLTALGQHEGWARLYWLAEGQNKAAQALYKNLGLKLDFTFHVMPLG